MDIERLCDLYDQRREERLEKLEQFWSGARNYLIVQRPDYHLWGECNSVEGVWLNNLLHMESWLSMDWSDELPHMQPWFGTGVYANAFGCEYLWRSGEAPDTRVRYQTIDEVQDLSMPDWQKSPVMKMVLDCIDLLVERTGGRFPVALTDTQSPCDTATLVLDSTEFFVGCYTHEETVADFMDTIASLIIEFSREQARRIGEELVSRPGHVMPSLPGFHGITLSDDNLAVSSPELNEKFSLPADQKVSDAIGGMAIHSCGVWDHTMKVLHGSKVMAVDCSVSPRWDPTPMKPEAVRAALAGSGIVVKARCGGTEDEILHAISALGGEDMRLILDIARIDDDDETYRQTAEINYSIAEEALAEISS